MLRRLSARDDRFKTVEFKDGLNIVVADKAGGSTETDSRNGAGKSSIVELLHFLLGGKGDRRSFLGKDVLRSIEFQLLLDWPTLDSGRPLAVRRSQETSGQIHIYPDVSESRLSSESFRTLTLAEWQRIIERDLFALSSPLPGISGRSMLSLYMRRISANAFNEAIKTSPQQTHADASSNLAYLLGLDWQLAAKYRQLSARESTRRQLAAASKDPVWGKIVGRSSELRGQINEVQSRVRDLENQISSFRVVPEYERLQAQADEIDQRIRQARNEDVADRRNLADLEGAMVEAVDPDVDYLSDVYTDLGVLLGEAVTRRYEEVREFHSSIIRNRRSYLESEAETLRIRLREREAERIRLGNEQASLLQTLNEGGALDALTALQQALARERALLESLRNRFEAAQTLEASAAEIKADRAQLEAQMRADLIERNNIIDDIVERFRQYAVTLYGTGRLAYLEVEPTNTHLKIVPHIDSQDSRGIGNMVMFCFDLAVAVTAHRGRRGPDFLVHDSHLFDGVDERQVARALELAREVTQEEEMQYVATINSDDLTKAQASNSDFSEAIIPPRLTDAYEDGGLFGFRFS
ncbi:ABC-three component system protein [Amycolatopsis pittospori]|uniref:ABC-three component system protein n=1 Tax=Amycolatopsis pittospori TaxID=2749434 RepID=UPI0015F0ADE8|nr:ABC-three component system protein [Amycolatopsis pittospori]